jgi:hypothetical protein
MSYLELPDGIPDFSKAVISLWFRVPKASLVACAQAAPDGDPPHLDTIIPFVTFGKPQTTPFAVQEQQVWSTYYFYDAFIDGQVNAAVPVISYAPVKIGDIYIDPSYLGISSVLDNSGKLLVAVEGNFQTTAIATFGGEMVVSGCTVPQPEQQPVTTTWAENNAPRGPQAYNFSISAADADSFADRWHHLLVSCDLSNEVSTTSAGATFIDGVLSYNRMWVALDDVNVDGYDAFPDFVGGSDLNAIITDDAYHAAATASPPYTLPHAEFQATTYTDSQGNTWTASGAVPDQNTGTSSTPITCEIDSASVPSSGAAIGIPATKTFVNHIYHCEMAEFQMWTGITLDTATKANRRAFIDDMGKPVPPDKKASPRDLQSGSIEFLGRNPDILLHRSGNWKAGNNTGSDGDFKPTGKIKSYKPDPSLHGPQQPGGKP